MRQRKRERRRGRGDADVENVHGLGAGDEDALGEDHKGDDKDRYSLIKEPGGGASGVGAFGLVFEIPPG